jgi:hypothetical protein
MTSSHQTELLEPTMKIQQCSVAEPDTSSKPWMLKQGCSGVALSSLHTVLELNSLVTQIWDTACLYQISNQYEVTTF